MDAAPPLTMHGRTRLDAGGLDLATYGSEGWGFESLRARHAELNEHVPVAQLAWQPAQTRSSGGSTPLGDTIQDEVQTP